MECSICGIESSDPKAAAQYPNFVCRHRPGNSNLKGGITTRGRSNEAEKIGVDDGRPMAFRR